MGASGCIIFSLCQEKERGATALDTGFPPYSHTLTLCYIAYNVDTLSFVAAQEIFILGMQIDPDKQTQLHKFSSFLLSKTLLARINFPKPS